MVGKEVNECTITQHIQGKAVLALAQSTEIPTRQTLSMPTPTCPCKGKNINLPSDFALKHKLRCTLIIVLKQKS